MFQKKSQWNLMSGWIIGKGKGRTKWGTHRDLGVCGRLWLCCLLCDFAENKISFNCVTLSEKWRDWIRYILRFYPALIILCTSDSKMIQTLQAWVVGRTSFHWWTYSSSEGDGYVLGWIKHVFKLACDLWPRCTLCVHLIPHHKDLSNFPHLPTLHLPATAPHSNV